MSGFSQMKNGGRPFGSGGRNGSSAETLPKENMFASLTAGLLARKGEAAPASAHLDGVSIHSHGVDLSVPQQQLPDPAPLPLPEPSDESRAEVRNFRPEPPKEPDHDELRRRAQVRAAEAVAGCCELELPEAVVENMPEGPRSTVTTRLDPERVRKLKILAARMGTSNQKVMLAALDHYLEYACDVLAAECPCLARSIKGEELP